MARSDRDHHHGPNELEPEGDFHQGRVSPGKRGLSEKLTAPNGVAAESPLQVHRKASGASQRPEASRQVAGARGRGGLPLPGALRSELESFSGADLGGVTVHTGGDSRTAARSISAHAYTEGKEIHFDSSFDPGSADGRRLIAHEVAHTIQQDTGAVTAGAVQTKLSVSSPGDAHEREADSFADAFVNGASSFSLRGSAGSGTLHRRGNGDEEEQGKSGSSDIKQVLWEAVRGIGTDEDAIFERAGRATPGEARAVLSDRALMEALTSDLNRGEMRRFLSVIDAPLDALLRAGVHGLGTDEDALFSALRQASSGEALSLLRDEELMGLVLSDLSAREDRRFLIILWAKVEEAGGTVGTHLGQARFALPLLNGGSQASRQSFARKLLDTAVDGVTELEVVKRAFEVLWEVDLTNAGPDMWERAWGALPFTDDVEEGTTWTVPFLLRIHRQFSILPRDHVTGTAFSELMLDTGGGGSMTRSDVRMKIGEDTHDRHKMMGVGGTLSQDASTGDTEIHVSDADLHKPGWFIQIDEDVYQIASNDIDNGTVTLVTALISDYEEGTRVSVAGTGHIRRNQKLESTVRHEIGHAIDGAYLDTSEFKAANGWWSGDFDAWVAKMGASAWQAADGTTLSEEEQEAVEEQIEAVTAGDDPTPLNDGLDEDHPVRQYWDAGVAVIDAIKPCAASGRRFYDEPTSMRRVGSTYFTYNAYYGHYQTHGEAVHANRVRHYMLFAPAEWFADLYSVFYEEAGDVPDEQLGRLIPVPEWRAWFRAHVHGAGLGAEQAVEEGRTSPARGMKTGDGT